MFTSIGILAMLVLAVGAFFSTEALVACSMAGFIFPILRSPDGGEGGADETEAEKEAKKIIAAVEARVNKLFEARQLTTKEELAALLKKVNDVEALNIPAIKQEVIDLAARLKALNEIPKNMSNGGLPLRDALEAAFAEPTVKAAIDACVAAGGKQAAPINVTLKVVGTISVASTIAAGDTQVSITENTGIISPIRKRELAYRAAVSVGRIGSNRAMWIEETDEEGTPIMLAEGATKTQLDVQYVEKTANVKKIAVYGKVTTELMADIPQLISYIQNNLMKRMDIVLEDNLLNGNNVGDNLNGAFNFATAFSAGAIAGTIPAANEYDVMEAIALQTALAFHDPNAIFVHPSTVAKMKLLKDTQGNYIFPRWASADGLTVAGMKVYASTAITEDKFIGGDLSVIQLLIRDELGIQIGLDGNDFISNKKTMLMEKRCVQFCSANDVAGVIEGDFSDAIAALML